NRFLNSDILLLSRKDEEFQELMMYFNQKMVSIVVEILTVINPELQENPPFLEAKMIMNLIQNSYPSFSKFGSEDEKERYIEKLVNIIFSISFNE
ncbi:TPA: TetR/AcrR family transcriptional regulator, partial [Streptococcus suis]|nr:TetR/AcrR family transcriptional regulator [Streptococcus suis]